MKKYLRRVRIQITNRSFSTGRLTAKERGEEIYWRTEKSKGSNLISKYVVNVLAQHLGGGIGRSHILSSMTDQSIACSSFHPRNEAKFFEKTLKWFITQIGYPCYRISFNTIYSCTILVFQLIRKY